MTSSIRLKKSPMVEEVLSTGVGIDPGVAPGFGFGSFGDDGDTEETAREFFIRTAVDVQFGKENGDFIVKAATIERLVDWLIINKEGTKHQSLLPYLVECNDSPSSFNPRPARVFRPSSLLSYSL
jgi:hypothetical protein